MLNIEKAFKVKKIFAIFSITNQDEINLRFQEL